MRGLAMETDTLTERFIPTEEFPNRIVAVVADKAYPLDEITTAIKNCPWDDVIWVYRDRDTVAQTAFEECGIDAVKMPLNPYWQAKPSPKTTYDKSAGYDLRRSVREFEMMYGCTHVLVFRNAASNVSKHWEGRISPRAAITIMQYTPKKEGKKK